MKVEDKPLIMPPAEKTQEVWQPENDFRTGFLTVFSLQSPSSAAVRKPPVFRAPRPANRADPFRLTHFASECSISRPSQRACAQSQKQRLLATFGDRIWAA